MNSRIAKGMPLRGVRPEYLPLWCFFWFQTRVRVLKRARNQSINLVIDRPDPCVPQGTLTCSKFSCSQFSVLVSWNTEVFDSVEA